MNNVILASLFSKLKRVEKQENKRFELIEEIRIDSNDTTVIERTQEPDGTAYAFEEALISLEMESAEANATLTCRANRVSFVGVGITDAIGTDKKYCSIHFQLHKGVLLTSYQTPVSNKTWTGNARTKNAEVMFAEEISSLRFSCNTPIPLGSKIAIYAVRK